MKKWIIVGLAAVVGIICVWYWLHFKMPSDAQVRRILPGAWHVEFSSPNQGESRFVIDSNLNFTHRTVSTNTNDTIESSGTFQVKDGALIETLTKSTYTKWRLPVIRASRIIRADNRRVMVFFDDTKEEFTLRRD